jgi:Ran-binding protein 3
VKKSRALSTPVEVDENDNDEQDGDFVLVNASDHEIPAPSPQPSPPNELKVRSISQSIEEIDCRNGQNTQQDSDDVVPVLTAPDNAALPDPESQIGTSSPTSAATTPELQDQADIEELPTGDVSAAAQMGELTATASVGPDAAPPPAIVPSVAKEVPAPSSTKLVSRLAAEPTHETDGQGSRDDVNREGSNSPEIKWPTPPQSEIDGATKRPREDEDSDLDPNPREAKRASPPPEKDKDKDKKEKPARMKSGADAHTLSAPASPRSRPVSGFVGPFRPGSCEARVC